MIGARRLLYLDAAGLTASLWRGHRLKAEGAFTPDSTGIDAFGAYLEAHRGSRYYLLAEVADEGFHPEDIPAVRGRDRIALIKRKLAHYYHGTQLTVALAQGRSKEGRRNERMVFAAFTRPQQFAPWLAALRQAEAALAVVFSVPQAVAPLAAHLGRAHPRFLLITLSRGGLRQTFFDAGQLRFSRLTLPAAAGADEAARACAAETAKIHHYLVSHRLLGDGTPLPVLVLAHPGETDVFRSHCLDSRDLHFEFHDLVAAAGHCGLKTPLPDSRAESLFAHLLLRQPPRAQFAHADSRRFFYLRRIRLVLGGAGLAILAVCLLVAGKQYLDSRALEKDTAHLRSENDANRQKYRAVLDARPPLPLPADRLNAVIGRYDALLRTSPDPGPLLRHLSQALDHLPAIELDRLDWSVDAAAARVAIEIHGRLPSQTAADRRGQLAAIEDLAERLRSDAGTQAQVLSLPFDTASGKVLKSGGGEVDTPKFRLRVTQAL